MRKFIVRIKRALRKLLRSPETQKPDRPLLSTTRAECIEEMRRVMARPGIVGRAPIDPPQSTRDVTGRVVWR
jgi:hypothetical protein